MGNSTPKLKNNRKSIPNLSMISLPGFNARCHVRFHRKQVTVKNEEAESIPFLKPLWNDICFSDRSTFCELY